MSENVLNTTQNINKDNLENMGKDLKGVSQWDSMVQLLVGDLTSHYQILNNRIDNLEKNMDTKFEKVDTKFDSVNTKFFN